MPAYAARRLLLLVPIAWGAASLLFVLFFVIPGDPVDLIAGAGGSRAVSDQVRTSIEAEYGLDRPLAAQYGDYMGRLLQGDLGRSYASGRSVATILGEALPASLRLAFWALAIEVVVGVGVGVLSAVRRRSRSDAAATLATAIIASVPVFVLGVVLQQALGVFPNTHGWPGWARLPVQGIGPDSWALWVIPIGEQWRYLVLPAIVLASVQTALIARLMRTTMLEVIRADYIRTARAKGLRERTVIVRHALPNALLPVVTLIGIDLGVLIGSAIITETVFNWPGLGSTLADAIGQRDAPVVLGGTLVLVLGYVVVNLLVDLGYGLLDPRVRGARERS